MYNGRWGVGLLPHVVRGLSMVTVRDFAHRRRLGDLLTAEPPVVFVRVVLPVIEVPIRRGFALSHTLMLTPSYSAVATAARSLLVERRSAVSSRRLGLCAL